MSCEIEGYTLFDKSYGFISFKYHRWLVSVSNIWHEQIGIKMFHIDTKEFIPFEYLTQVPYHELKHIDFFLDKHNKGFVMDVVNKQYAYTTNFPFNIYEIDGNMITSCIDKNNNKIYIFYSYTDEYQTGIFIFDIQSNSYDIVDDAFFYDKDISSCVVYGDTILINMNDTIYNYNTMEKLFDLVDITYHNQDIVIFGNKLLVTDKKYVNVYDLETHVKEKSIKVKEKCFTYIRYLDVYDNDLVIRNSINTSNISNYIKIINLLSKI